MERTNIINCTEIKSNIFLNSFSYKIKKEFVIHGPSSSINLSNIDCICWIRKKRKL